MLVGLLITNVCFFIISCFKLEVNLFGVVGFLGVLVFLWCVRGFLRVSYSQT